MATKKQTQRNVTVRPKLIALLAVILLLGVATYALIQNNSSNSSLSQDVPNSHIVPDQRLSGDVSELNIAPWGIKVSFKDADKTVYKITDPKNNSFEIYLSSNYLPYNGCGRVGIAVERSESPESDTTNTQIGSFFYRTVGAPGYCDTTQKDDSQTANLVRNLLRENAGGKTFSISSL